jgi:DNA-binding PadR family transcriptional regulator
MFGQEFEGPRPAFARGGDFGPGGYEGWQPWARREGPPFGPFIGRAIWRMARQFPFGPGMPRGGPRMFGRGDLKYGLLALLEDRPKHGYEMIKELEERSGGFYTPSAGAVYPTLQLLEDRGWVTSQTADGKKVYSITDAGRAALAEQRQRGEERGEEWNGPWGFRTHGHGHGHHEHEHEHGPFGRYARPELRALRHESMEVARLMRAAVLASGGDPERLARLRAIVTHTRDELNAYLGQGGSAQSDTPPAPAGEPPVEQV